METGNRYINLTKFLMHTNVCECEHYDWNPNGYCRASTTLPTHQKVGSLPLHCSMYRALQNPHDSPYLNTRGGKTKSWPKQDKAQTRLRREHTIEYNLQGVSNFLHTKTSLHRVI